MFDYSKMFRRKAGHFFVYASVVNKQEYPVYNFDGMELIGKTGEGLVKPYYVPETQPIGRAGILLLLIFI